MLGVYDEYVKKLLNQVASQKFITASTFTTVKFCQGAAHIDGIIKSMSGEIAVEIESRKTG